MDWLTFDPAPIEKEKIPPWVLLLGGIFVIRLYTLTLSGFGWYHGFNEAVYTEIAQGYNSNPWFPSRRGAAFFDTGPFTTYLMWVSHSILGVSEASSRLPALLAYPVAVWAAWKAAEGFYGPGKGKVAAILVGSTPWVLLWFGRAQTDAWMTAGILLVLAGIATREGWRRAVLVSGGFTIGILSKQPALLLAPIVVLYDLTRRGKPGKPWRELEFVEKIRYVAKFRLSLYTTIGVAAASLWWIAMYALHPDAFESSLLFHAEERASFAGNLTWSLVLGIVVGAGGILFFSWQAKKPNTLLFATFLAYAFFALFNAPVGHEYYTLPAIAILGILAANWKWTKLTLTGAVAVSLIFTVSVLSYTGDFDDRQNKYMGAYISTLPEAQNVTAPDRLVPQLELYSGRVLLYGEELNQSKGAFMVSWDSLPCPELAKVDRTFKNPPLRLFDCRIRSQDVSETVDSEMPFYPEQRADYPARSFVEARFD